MVVESTALRHEDSWYARVDTDLVILAILMVTVQVLAVWAVASPLQQVNVPAPVETNEHNPATAVPILLLLFIEVLAMLGIYWMYRHLPHWVQRWVKRIGILGGVAYAFLYAFEIIPELFIGYALIAVAWLAGYEWLAYDIGAVLIAIVIAATLGGYLGPFPLAIILAVLIVYDYLSVVETTVMEQLVKVMAGIKYFPMMVVLPKQWAFDLKPYLEDLADNGLVNDEDTESAVSVAVGVGDFGLPAAFTVSVYRLGEPLLAGGALVGTVVGLVGLMWYRQETDDALPGLPWLGTGAIAGFAAIVVVLYGGNLL